MAKCYLKSVLCLYFKTTHIKYKECAKMKKILLGCIMLSAVSYAQDLGVTFKQLEKEYRALIKKEETLYTTKKNAATEAQKELLKQRQLYRQVEEKQNKLLEVKDVRFYKEQYKGIADKLGIVMEEMKKEMNVQESIIKEFKAIEKIKEGR